jgi:hypothetical protein
MSIDSEFEYGRVYEIKMINYDHILIRTVIGLIHLKIDYDAWNATAVSIDCRKGRTLVVDELNERRVLIDRWDNFSIGTLIGDEFVIDAEQEFNFRDLQWPKLSGDKLIGFRNVDEKEESWQFCQVDLNTLSEERVDVPSVLSNYRPVSF